MLCLEGYVNLSHNIIIIANPVAVCVSGANSSEKENTTKTTCCACMEDREQRLFEALTYE